MKTGKLTSKTFVFLETHEAQTINFLLDIGKDIEILVPVRSKGLRTPDIAMDGVCWEIKCPVGNGKYTIQRIFKHAVKQSENIILDLRKTRLSDDICLHRLKAAIFVFKKHKALVSETPRAYATWYHPNASFACPKFSHFVLKI